MIYYTRGQIANYQVTNPWSPTPEIRSLTTRWRTHDLPHQRSDRELPGHVPMIYHTRGQIANYQVMNPWSTTPEVRSLTITPPIQFHRQYINYWTNTYCNDNIIFINVVRTKLMNEKDYKIIPQILCLLHTMTYSSKLTTIVYWQGGPVKRRKKIISISAALVHGVYTSQLIRYSRACDSYQDFLIVGCC